MLRRFLYNTAVSAVAYGLAGVLGLFAVGLIAKSYGLAALGVIVLARSFLPSAFLSLFDFGFSEVATQAVARGRVGDWAIAGEKLALLTLMAAASGILTGVIIWFSGATLAAVFRIAPDQTAVFVSILKVTALLLPVMYVGLIAEGTLKGFEEYGWLRLTEVGGNVLYVMSVYAAVWSGAPFEVVAYSYLAMIFAKYLVLAIAVYAFARGTPLRSRAWSTQSRDDVLYRCWLMFNNRVTGALQQPLVPLAIGAIYGPTGVGTYDLITRLPRFLKATMTPLHSAILPMSTRIEETTDQRRLQLLGRNGLVLPAAIVVPVLVVIGLFSREILRVWVGPQYVDQAPWLTLSLLVPAIGVMLGAGQTALMVRADFLSLNTRYLYLQVLTQYVLTAATLVWFHEQAFILGWVMSSVVFAPLVAHRMLSLMSLPISLFWEQVGRQAGVAALLAAAVLNFKAYYDPESMFALVIAAGIACLLAWVLSAMFILTKQDRAMLARFGRAIVQRQ